MTLPRFLPIYIVSLTLFRFFSSNSITSSKTGKFFYKELKNDFFQTLTEEALSDFLEEKKLHIIENITEKEKTIFIFKIKEISKLK
jgi:hypothetical protein